MEAYPIHPICVVLGVAMVGAVLAVLWKLAFR